MQQPEPKSTYFTLFEAYPAQRKRPVTRSFHPYEPTEEPEATTSTVKGKAVEVIEDESDQMDGVPLNTPKETERNKEDSSAREKNHPIKNATAPRPKKKVVTKKRLVQKAQPSIAAHI